MILAWHDAQLGGVPCMRIHIISFLLVVGVVDNLSLMGARNTS